MKNKQSLFPITIDTQWMQFAPVGIDATLASWLFDPASLTARLKEHCLEFRVEVLGEVLDKCSEDEANEFIVQGQDVIVREVLLWCDNQPQVFARSLLPLTSLTGDQTVLSNLGSESLGQVLFNLDNLERKAIEVSFIEGASVLTPLLDQLNLPLNKRLAARRSIFLVDAKPVMVAEVFLPGAFPYRDNG